MALAGWLDCFAVRGYVCMATHRACEVTSFLSRPQYANITWCKRASVYKRDMYISVGFLEDQY